MSEENTLIGWRRWRRFQPSFVVKYLLGRGSHHGISGIVYGSLWIIGVLGSSIAFMEWSHLQRQWSHRTDAVDQAVVLLLGMTTVLLLTAIYIDLHRMEYASDVYPGWQNRRLERVLRALILVSLVFGVGEVAHAFLPLAKAIQVEPIRDSLVNWLHAPENSREFSRSLFVKGSAVAFASLTVWNGFAVFFSWKLQPWDRRATLIRMALFFVLTLFSALFWVLFLMRSSLLSRYSWSIWLPYGVVALAFGGLFFGRRRRIKARRFSPVESSAWRGRLFEIYYRMRSEARASVECNGLTLKVLPSVYVPGYFTDSEWFAKELAALVGCGSLLEIGTGTGVIAISCAKEGARVVATDVNPSAVECAKENAVAASVSIDVRLGDVYDPIAGGERFDFIFWAHPFNNWPAPIDDMLLRSGMDYGYESLKRYIGEAKGHLANDGGRLLLGTGDTADLEAIYDFAEKFGYTPKLLKEEDLLLAGWGEERIRYMVLELVAR